jgi:hypothetical protein
MKNIFKFYNILIFAIIFILISNIPIIDSKQVSTGSENNVTNSNKVIFRDDFNNDSDHWYHWNSGSGYHSLVYHPIVKEWYYRLTILYGNPEHYHNAEIWTNGSFPYLYNNFKANISIDRITKGSKGWGFYNREYCNDNMSYAWFMYNRFSRIGLFPTNGFFAISWNSINDWSIKRIRNVNIKKWHTYEINWTENNVDFFIDGKNVAHFTRGIPTKPLKVDVWIDNMNFLPPFFGKIMSVTLPNAINIDYIEVTE